MDDKAKRESNDQAGWEWRPLREKDHITTQGWSQLNTFGNVAVRTMDRYGSRSGPIEIPASDYYHGHYTSSGNRYTSSQRVYDLPVPLHALKKVALIEREHKGPVHFFVCDYAPAPAIEYADPFLMAVIPNPRVGQGDGRFVIDFWSEPGFGLTQMLK